MFIQYKAWLAHTLFLTIVFYFAFFFNSQSNSIASYHCLILTDASRIRHVDAKRDFQVQSKQEGGTENGVAGPS